MNFVEAMELLLRLRSQVVEYSSEWRTLTNAVEYINHQFWEHLVLVPNFSDKDPIWNRMEVIERELDG